jgi:LysR family glycine cleavage system transcriptional activator
MVLQAAAHGQGIALGNNVLAQPEIEAGRLVPLFDKVLMTDNAFYLVCHEKQANTGRIATFRNWMLNRARREQEVILDDNYDSESK